MTATKRWTVDIYLGEDQDRRRTYAEARLHTDDATDLRGTGTAMRNPRDREVPEIGDEVAAARALSDLAVKLNRAAFADMEQLGAVREPVDG